MVECRVAVYRDSGNRRSVLGTRARESVGDRGMSVRKPVWSAIGAAGALVVSGLVVLSAAPAQALTPEQALTPAAPEWAGALSVVYTDGLSEITEPRRYTVQASIAAQTDDQPAKATWTITDWWEEPTPVGACQAVLLSATQATTAVSLYEDDERYWWEESDAVQLMMQVAEPDQTVTAQVQRTCQLHSERPPVVTEESYQIAASDWADSCRRPGYLHTGLITTNESGIKVVQGEQTGACTGGSFEWVTTTADLSGEPADLADLAVSLSGFSAQTRMGKLREATVTVSNKGTVPAEGVELTMHTPKGMMYGATRWAKLPSGPWSCDGEADELFTCTLDALAPKASVNLKLGCWPKKRRRHRRSTCW